MEKRLDLGPSSFILEIASNDGCMLRNFIPMGVVLRRKYLLISETSSFQSQPAVSSLKLLLVGSLPSSLGFTAMAYLDIAYYFGKRVYLNHFSPPGAS